MTEINADKLLKPLRDEIDALDQQLVSLLGQRYNVVRRVAELKAKHNLSPVQKARMEVVLNRVAEIGAGHDLDPEFMRAMWSLMIDYAHEIETPIIESETQ